jgi:Rad3-related DNA helicase
MNSDGPATQSSGRLEPEQGLMLHQLLQLRSWQERVASRVSTAGPSESGASTAAVPGRWELTQGTVLHDWQERCVDAWFAHKRGVIKVVTGAGKTLLALAIAERLQQTTAPQLRVVVVVPTVVLMDQWCDELKTRSNLSKQVESVKHLLWHGNVAEALERLADLLLDLDMIGKRSAAAEKLAVGLAEFETYIRTNQESIPNFGERYRQGETISTAFVESTINQVVSRRFVKKQQMQWTLRGAHLLLQTRAKVLNNELEGAFRRWYPLFRVHAQAA